MHTFLVNMKLNDFEICQNVNFLYVCMFIFNFALLIIVSCCIVLSNSFRGSIVGPCPSFTSVYFSKFSTHLHFLLQVLIRKNLSWMAKYNIIEQISIPQATVSIVMPNSVRVIHDRGSETENFTHRYKIWVWKSGKTLTFKYSSNPKTGSLSG